MPQETEKLITEWYRQEGVSRDSSYLTVLPEGSKRGDRKVPARILIHSLRRTVLTCPYYKHNSENGWSRSKIISLRPNDVRLPRASTGLCIICETEKSLVSQFREQFDHPLLNKMKGQSYEPLQIPKLDELESSRKPKLESEKWSRDKISKALKDLEGFETHTDYKNRFFVRQNNMYSEWEEGLVRLIYDEKKALEGGRGGDENDQTYRNLFQITCVGVALQTKKNIGSSGKVNNLWRFFLSKSHDKTAAAQIEYLREFLKDPAIKKLLESKHTLEISTDTARNLKNQEMGGWYLTIEIK